MTSRELETDAQHALYYFVKTLPQNVDDVAHETCERLRVDVDQEQLILGKLNEGLSRKIIDAAYRNKHPSWFVPREVDPKDRKREDAAAVLIGAGWKLEDIAEVLPLANE